MFDSAVYESNPQLMIMSCLLLPLHFQGLLRAVVLHIGYRSACSTSSRDVRDYLDSVGQ
jgi:hypothetical protein